MCIQYLSLTTPSLHSGLLLPIRCAIPRSHSFVCSILVFILSFSVHLFISRSFFLSILVFFSLVLFIFLFFLQLIGLSRIVTTAVPYRQTCMHKCASSCVCVWVCSFQNCRVWYYSSRNEISYLLSYEIVSTNTICWCIHRFCYARASAKLVRCVCVCVYSLWLLVLLLFWWLSENTTHIWIDMLAVTKFIAGYIVSNHIQISNNTLFAWLKSTQPNSHAQLIYWLQIHTYALIVFMIICCCCFVWKLVFCYRLHLLLQHYSVAILYENKNTKKSHSLAHAMTFSTTNNLMSQMETMKRHPIKNWVTLLSGSSTTELKCSNQRDLTNRIRLRIDTYTRGVHPYSRAVHIIQ